MNLHVRIRPRLVGGSLLFSGVAAWALVLGRPVPALIISASSAVLLGLGIVSGAAP